MTRTRLNPEPVSSSEHVTVSSQYAEGDAYFDRRGNSVTARISLNVKQQVSDRTNVVPIPDGFKPVAGDLFGMWTRMAYFVVNTNYIQLEGGTTAGNVWGSITYTV